MARPSDDNHKFTIELTPAQVLLLDYAREQSVRAPARPLTRTRMLTDLAASALDAYGRGEQRGGGEGVSKRKARAS